MSEADESAIDEREIDADLPGIPFWELREGRCRRKAYAPSGRRL